MRLIFIALVLLTAIIQYPLWLGKGGWLRVNELEHMLASQHETNEALLARNAAMQAEVQDLKTGTDAVEERARAELGMVKEGEVYVQILSPNDGTQRVTTPSITDKPGN